MRYLIHLIGPIEDGQVAFEVIAAPTPTWVFTLPQEKAWQEAEIMAEAALRAPIGFASVESPVDLSLSPGLAGALAGRSVRA